LVIASAPPTTVEEYEFSLPLDTLPTPERPNVRPQFRFRLPDGGEWRVGRIAGKAECVHADGETGKLYLRGTLAVANNVGYMYAAADAVPDPEAEGGEESHWRCCYARAERAWRLRDERKPDSDPTAIRIVSDYRGILNLNWFDGGTHVFHDGAVTVDSKGVAHFGDA
jgi:hypothetical protein